MQQRLVELLQAFVAQTLTLRSCYLLFADDQSEFEPDTAESLFAFALWFIVWGRGEFRAPAVLSDGFRTALTTPAPDGCHPLMHYLAQQRGQDLRGSALRAWYYGEGVIEARVAGYLSRAELAALGRPLSATSGETLLQRLTDAPPIDTGRQPRRDAFLTLLSRLSTSAAPERAVPSVTIVGLHRSVLGIGEDARCLFACLCEAGIVAGLVDVSAPDLESYDRADDYAPFETGSVTGSVVVFCLPAFEMMRTIGALNLTRDKERQRWVGYWPWETTSLPASWRHVYDVIDEIWASSRFLVQVYAGETSKPVVHMPLHVEVDEIVVPEDVRPVFEGRFSFLSIFDFNSRIERKNPLGAIAAFRRAFPATMGDVQLVLKTLNAEQRRKDFERLMAAASGDPRIVVMDGVLPKAEICGLITLADVYLSLHRSEGFGRPIAEAMLLETPVIATGWSGPNDFLTERTGFPVRSTLRAVEKGEYAFAVGDWAEPDIDHAASLMREIHARPQIAQQRAIGAKYSVEHTFGRKTIAALLLQHLSDFSAGARPTPFRTRR